MSDRDLTTSKTTVFGPPPSKGTTCRVCGRDVDDGRATHCSDYCRTIANRVMEHLNWTSVRRMVLDRDDHICQECGFKRAWIDRGRDHVREIIFDENLPDRPRAPSVLRLGKGDVSDEEMEEWKEKDVEWCVRRDELMERYGDPSFRGGKRLEVDHITPISEGGHPFDPANLRTLCADCHEKKTVREHKERADHRRMDRPEIKLVEFVEGGDGSL